jgi:hypothetical protein
MAKIQLRAGLESIKHIRNKLERWFRTVGFELHTAAQHRRHKAQAQKLLLPAAVGDHAARTASTLRSQMIATTCFRVLLYLVDIYSSHLNYLLISNP